MDLGQSLADIQYTIAAQRREDNSHRVAGKDGPALGANIPEADTVSNNTLSFALSSTAKKSLFGDDDDEFGQQVDENGEVSFDEKAGVSVNVSSDGSQIVIDFTEDEGIKADDGKYVPLPSEKEIEDKIKERTKAGSECAKAVENLINRLGQKANSKKPKKNYTRQMLQSYLKE